jgi:anti-sigma-K factor RskA
MEKQDLPRHAPDMSVDQALALDFVLGILVDPWLTEATGRYHDDDSFRRMVDGYRHQLELDQQDPACGTDDVSPIAPTPDTWAAIQKRIANP